MGRHIIRAVPTPLAQHERAHQRRDPGTDVDHRATGKIHRAHLGEPSAPPQILCANGT